jgi:hypothetical protein
MNAIVEVMRRFTNNCLKTASANESRGLPRSLKAAGLAGSLLLAACGAHSTPVATQHPPTTEVSGKPGPHVARTSPEIQQRREALAGTCIRLGVLEQSELTKKQKADLSHFEQAVLAKDTKDMIADHGRLFSRIISGNEIDFSKPGDAGLNIGLRNKPFLVIVEESSQPASAFSEQTPQPFISDGSSTTTTTAMAQEPKAEREEVHEVQIDTRMGPVYNGAFTTKDDQDCWV